MEEEPIRALAREARGFAEEEEEESPHAAAPETRSRIAMVANKLLNYYSSSNWNGGGCFVCLLWSVSVLLPLHRYPLLGCFIISMCVPMLLVIFFPFFFYNFLFLIGNGIKNLGLD